MKQRPELVAFVLAAVVVAAAAVILLAGKAVPSWFPIVALAAVTGGAGLAVPGGSTGDEATSSATPPTTADGWTLDDLSSWIDDEIGKLRVDVARALRNGGGGRTVSPAIATGQSETAPPPPSTTPTPAEAPQAPASGPVASAPPGSVL